MIDCYVYHHLGLGDHLICNGLVRSFINKNKLNRISLVVKKRNLTNVMSYLNVGEDYIFVHDKCSTGDYKLDIKSDLRQIKPDKIPCESSIFDWIGIIENAKEIHAINSSFVHLIDSVKTNGKLYYHNKPNMFGFSLKKNWDFTK
jgi:hypothetical protein